MTRFISIKQHAFAKILATTEVSSHFSTEIRGKKVRRSKHRKYYIEHTVALLIVPPIGKTAFYATMIEN